MDVEKRRGLNRPCLMVLSGKHLLRSSLECTDDPELSHAPRILDLGEAVLHESTSESAEIVLAAHKLLQPILHILFSGSACKQG